METDPKMIRLFLIIVLLAPSFSYGQSKEIKHQDPLLERSFNDVYHKLRSKHSFLTNNTSGQYLVGQGNGVQPIWQATGLIKQVLEGTSTTNFTTTSASYQTTNLTQAITVSEGSSVIILAFGNILNNTSVSTTFRASLFRDSTNIGDANSLSQMTMNTAPATYQGSIAMGSVDAGLSAGTYTYSVKILSTDATTTVGFGTAGQQTMILIEVGA